jgi:repressor LexA
MTHIGERVANRRRELGLTQQELADKLGYKSKTTINKIELGINDLRQRKIVEFASVLHCSPAYLMGWTDDPNQNTLAPSPDMVDEIPSIRPGAVRRMIPVLGRISAGVPLYAEENIEYYISTDVVGEGDYFALKVKGDSMNAARIYDGDILIVRKQDIVEDNDIAVVLVNGDEATVKRFHRSGDLITLVPQSTNPAHTIQVYDPEQVPVKVLGKVVRSLVEFE